MNLSTILKRSEDYLSNEIDHELVMMNISTGSYASLNETAKLIWQFLDTPKTVQEIMDVLRAEYHVSKEQCTNDLAPFIGKMLDKKMLEII